MGFFYNNILSFISHVCSVCRLNVIQNPRRGFLGYISQVYFWAGASFPKGGEFSLSELASYPLGSGRGPGYTFRMHITGAASTGSSLQVLLLSAHN